MNPEDLRAPADTGITRRELPAVIRRAAELQAGEAEGDERLSEADVLQIAAEIGLPAAYVRQALYELPAGPAGPPSRADRIFGATSVRAARTVPGEPEPTMARLQDYLVTREYLRLVRRQPGRAWLEPAEDPLSFLARTFRRPTRRHFLAHARQVLLSVRPIEARRSHVQLEIDLQHLRRNAVAGGVVLGAAAGAALGVLAFLFIGGGAEAFVGSTAAAVAGIAAGITAQAAAIASGAAAAAARFRRRAALARTELEALLDRLEQGESLEPPAGPWRRRFQLRGSGLLLWL